MNISEHIRDRVIATVTQNIQDANNWFGIELEIPTIIYNLKGGRCAGRADINLWSISLNESYFLENEENMINVTVPHEVAHLIDFTQNPANFCMRNGKKRIIHGDSFKFILGQVLGCNDTSTTHSMNNTTNSIKPRSKYRWVSNQDDSVCMYLGQKRHNNMLKGKKYYPRGYSNHTFSYIQYNHHDLSNRIKEIPAEVSQVMKPAGPVSKKERVSIVYNHGTLNRQEFIHQCITDIGMTKAGASTYYNNFKNNKW